MMWSIHSLDDKQFVFHKVESILFYVLFEGKFTTVESVILKIFRIVFLTSLAKEIYFVFDFT